jgi:hypothetical protein
LCPDSGLTCKAILRNHRRYCDLVNPDHPSYNEQYVDLMCAGSNPIRVAVEPQPPADPVEAELFREIYECPYRSRRETINGTTVHIFQDGTEAQGCGCSKNACQLGKGQDGHVSVDDCRQCVLARRETPGWLTMGKNLLVSMYKHVRAGMPEVGEEERERRLATCRGCEHYRPEQERCGQCGCFLRFKTKWAGEACPLTPPRWGASPAPVPGGEAAPGQ